VNDLAQQEHLSWSSFRNAVDRLTPALFESPTTAGWTAKEMIGHLAFWCEAAEGVVVAMFRGEPLRPDFTFGSGYTPDPDAPWPLVDVHNAREAAWARLRPASEVLARLDTAHARLVEILASLRPDEVADERYRTYVRGVATEFDAHLLELDALLDSGPPTQSTRCS
jgi:hypothetical protein